MVPLRGGARGAVRAFSQARFLRPITQSVRRYAAEAVATAPPPASASIMSELETASSLATEAPKDRKMQRKIRRFNPRGRAMARRYELPGTRYQYHPPKYDRGPLHPIQPQKSSEPTSRQFIPGPFGIPRIKHTFHDAIAHDILTLAYTHKIPGEDDGFIPRKYEDRLKTWDDSSPYHKNRGPQPPRGGSPRLPLLEKPIDFGNIPQLQSVALSCYVPESNKNRDAWVSAWTALRAITGKSPWNIRTKNPATQWHTQRGGLAGVRTMIKGDAAYEFVDRLIHFVLPRIKDWPGLEATTGDKNGNIQLGLKPDWVGFFPEIQVNHDMYPVRLIPGMRISINTSAQSNRHARLLMQALGMPFKGRIKN